MVAVRRNPIRKIRECHSGRGMSWRRDVTDWLRGHASEATTPGEIEILKFGRRNLNFVGIKQNIDLHLGVGEFVFESTAHDRQS